MMKKEKELFSPEFIPYYIEDVKKYKLSPSQAIVYGFIRFYCKTGNTFKRSSDDMSVILGLKSGTIDNVISALNKKGAILSDTKRYMTGSVRCITLPTSGNSESHLTKGGGAISSNDEVLSHQTVRCNKEVYKEVYKEPYDNNNSKPPQKKKTKGVMNVKKEEAIERIKKGKVEGMDLSNKEQECILAFFMCGYEYNQNEDLSGVHEWLRDVASGIGNINGRIPRATLHIGLQQYRQRKEDKEEQGEYVKNLKSSIRQAIVTKGRALPR